MKQEIKHRIKNVYKQGNRPICGIYAFLNGVFYDDVSASLHKDEIDELAKHLWQKAININSTKLGNYDSCINSNTITTSIPDQYSVMGEFFSSNSLICFLDSISSDKELTEKMSSCGINDFNIEPEIKGEKQSIQNALQNINDDEFYLIPINSSSGKGKGENNMHWICYKRCNSELTIFDSNPSIFSRIVSLLFKRHVPEGRALKNSDASGNANIYTIEELATVYENMYDRESKYEAKNNGQHACYNFYRWHVKKKTIAAKKIKAKICSKVLIDYWIRLGQINEGCKYEFNKDEFSIIPVRVIR